MPNGFPLGRVLITPAALTALEIDAPAGAPPHPASLALPYLLRHARGEWGNLTAEDRAANDRALIVGARLLSAYHTPGGTKLWIITEADRSSTTILLPEDY